MLNRFLLRFGTTFELYTKGVAIGRGGIVKKVCQVSAFISSDPAAPQ